MISNQTILQSITDLKNITKIDLGIFEPGGSMIAATFDTAEMDPHMISEFSSSPADSQVIGEHHLLKVMEDEEVQYVVDARSLSDDSYMIGKIAASHLQELALAYRERFDRNNFFQNLILDNLLLVDVYNRAKKLHIQEEAKRVVFLIETLSQDETVEELLRSMFSSQNGDYITSVDEGSLILIKNLEEDPTTENCYAIARSIVDTVGAEAMVNVRIAFGNVVGDLKDVSKSYKEATMALEVGRIFYADKPVVSYESLGIGRLIYQLPVSLCRMFIQEIFGGNKIPSELDEETLNTVNKFFENSLNVSETSRQLFIHRNTLVYRIEKLQKATGLDIRTFDDAMTLKIALMVGNYMNYLDKKVK